MEATIRQRIVEFLKQKPADTRSISQAVGISQRAVESHLEHVAKSAGNAFKVTPPQCMDCGFKFRDRSRTTKPSRCPKCKSEGIMPAMFFIEEQKA
jgi:transcriptional regulator